MNRCEHCPIANGKPCLAVATNAARLCELALNDSGYRELLVTQSAQIDPGEPTLPPLWKQAANFVVAAVQHVADGMPTVSDEERDRRLDVCRSCSRFIADQGRCSVCGCYMATKASWDQVQCPEGRW